MARFRFTGVSWVGIQWEKKDDDREIARRVLNLLGDRRMLWADFTQEIDEHCVKSALKVRGDLESLIINPEISPSLESELKALQALFRTFVDEVPPDKHLDDRHWSPYGTDRLSMALGRLRALVGIHVGQLASRYDLEVSAELATIVPDVEGWFFEGFGSK